MPDLLFELGCEELPATFVAKAVDDLANGILARLQIAFGVQFDAEMYATPRRLIIGVKDIPARQEDSVAEVRGPSLKAAFDASHNPLPPLVGFCRSQGVGVESVQEREGYAWISKPQVGKDSRELLASILPDAVKAMSFDKSMRWGHGSFRFARPIRWLLASLDGQCVDFEVQGVASGLYSRGHRFYAPERFEASTLPNLLTELRKRKVEPDATLRKEMIVNGANQQGLGQIDFSEALLEENVYLNEWPISIAGDIRQAHMELPEAVLVTAMAKHEKMFPVRDESGKLVSKFVFVRNGGEDETVRRGAEWVLNARLDDAQFFFSEDCKRSMAEFLDQTSRIVFQAKLGSVRDRAERLHDLASFIANRTGADETESDLAARAGLFAKADLSTGLVSELPSLQGIIGAAYSEREAFAEPVCYAIGRQYRPETKEHPRGAKERTAWRLVMADAVDKLAGFLGIGEVPSGSSDPFGLRRAASTVIELSWAWPDLPGSIIDWVIRAGELYQHQHFAVDLEKALSHLDALMRTRYESLLEDVRYDVLAGVLDASRLSDLLDPSAIRFRCECMTDLAKDSTFVRAATRPINLVDSSRKKAEVFSGADLAKNQDRLDSDSGLILAQKLFEVESGLSEAHQSRNKQAVVDALQSLEPAINQFFEETMVMVEDDSIRASRLSLLDRSALILMRVGNFSKLVQAE